MKTLRQKVNTKHCAQLKQVAPQIPLSGSCSSGNFGCQAVYAAKTTHTVKTQHEKIVSLIWLNLIYCEHIFVFLIFSFEGEIS
jgi:hypothetical protein